MVTLILASGSFIIYHTARLTLYDQIDKNLISMIALESLELEMVDGEIFHEWLSDIEKDSMRSASDYVQVWNEVTGATTRSPALQGADLPKMPGANAVVQIVSLKLPNGKYGRAIYKQIWPVQEVALSPGGPAAESAEVGEIISVKSLPHIMAVALDAEDAESALLRLAGTLLLGLVFSLFVSIVTIRLIITFSFRPLDRLEQAIQHIDVDNPKDVFDLPTDLPSELEGAVVRYRDLLSRISLVREREREFSGNVAHELRTPLAGIEATLEQALAVDREAADYRSRIAETLKIATRMRELVNRLMWFSRLNRGDEAIVMEEVDVHMLIEARLSILSEEIGARGLRVERSLGSDLSVLQTDETLASILMNNLIGNAVAHADAHSVVKLATWDEADGLHFELINEAKDFNEAELQRIFEPFYRTDRVRTAEGAHSGIGLSLASGVARLIGIELGVRFEPPGSFIVEVIFPKK